jgi:calpain-7
MGKTSFETLEHQARDAERHISTARSAHGTLEATINAAELYMRALRLCPSSTEKVRLDLKCKELLTKAETLKEVQGRSDKPGENDTASSLPSRAAALKQPTSKRKLTTREEIILLEGSKLNGFLFPPWKSDPASNEFVLKDGEELFVDSQPLQLSPLQLKTFAGWKRPWEAFAAIDISQDGLKLPTEPTMQPVKNVDLVQDMTSDCSVVASLCAGSARAQRGHPRVSG